MVPSLSQLILYSQCHSDAASSARVSKRSDSEHMLEMTLFPSSPLPSSRHRLHSQFHFVGQMCFQGNVNTVLLCSFKTGAKALITASVRLMAVIVAG